MNTLTLKNATIKKIRNFGKITISKMEFKKGNEEHYIYNDRRRLGLILTTLFGRRKVTMTTAFSGKEKTRTFNLLAGRIISW